MGKSSAIKRIMLLNLVINPKNTCSHASIKSNHLSYVLSSQRLNHIININVICTLVKLAVNGAENNMSFL